MRSVERGLMGLVTLVLSLGYLYLTVALTQAPHDLLDPGPMGPWPHWVAAVSIIATMWTLHIVLSIRRSKGDPYLLPIATLLVGIGWMEVMRVAPSTADRQAMWVVVGAGCFLAWILGVRDYRPLQDYRGVLLVAALGLQLITMVFGTEVNGARLWLHLGPLSFQPVEVVKILVVLFLASYLRDYRELLSVGFLRGRLVLLRYLVPLMLLVGACEAMFAFQKDLGIGLLLFGVFILLFFVTTRRFDFVALGVGLFGGLAWTCYRFLPHVRVRFMAWANPWPGADTWGYQMVQSLYALGSGGMTGQGLGMGQPWNIPEVHTDFIFVALTEELGLVGAAAIVMAYALLVERAFRIARRALLAGEDYGAILAWGLGATLLCQSFIVIAGTINMAPMTGITLPFVSYGGSSLLTNFLLLALLLQISDRTSDQRVPESPSRTRLRRTMGTSGRLALLLLLLPLAYLTRFDLLFAPTLAASPQNPRNREDLRLRGGLLDRRNVWLGKTQQGGTELLRTYPQGPLTCHVVGYWDVRYGVAGLEADEDRRLRGPGLPKTPGMALANLRGTPLVGPDAVLTLDLRLQKLASDLLGDRNGAIVALDPRNGDILASVSRPGFDPNRLEQDWGLLSSSPRVPLLDRVSNGFYPPGSVFKLLTLAAGLQSGAIQPSDTFYCPGYLDVGGYRLHCNQGEVHGTVDVQRALAESCNVAFAQMALKIGATRFSDTVHQLLPRVRQPVPMTDAELAQEGFGQGTLLVSPLEVATLVATIARGGQTVVPRQVEAWRSGGRTTVVDVSPGTAVLGADVTRTETGMMQTVVTSGTGTGARLDKIDVAGKTGTAENPHGLPHAWFAAFAPAEAPRIVVVVLVENGGYGGDVAAPIARQMIQMALEGPAGEGESLHQVKASLSPVRPGGRAETE